MSQYHFHIYFSFILYIIIQIKYGISEENITTAIVDASGTLPCVLQENGTTQVAGEPKILFGVSKENDSKALIDTSNILPGISEISEIVKGVDASNILIDVLQENGSAEVANESDILSGILQENGITEVLNASNILSGISQENITTEMVDASGILEENGAIEAARESETLLGVSKENNAKAVIDTSNILPGILELNETTKRVDASNTLLDVLQENGSAEVADGSDILPGILEENRITEILNASNILSGISQENRTAKMDNLSVILEKNGTIEVEGKSRILIGVSKENKSKTVIDTSNILPGISEVSETTKKVDLSNIFTGISQVNGSTENIHASDILPGISQQYGTTEKVDASDIFPGTSQKHGATENVHASDILPGISQEYETTENVYASDNFFGIPQEYGITENIHASDILPGISQEYDTTENIHASDILPGISQKYGTTENIHASDILLGISQQYGTTGKVDASDVFPSISQKYGSAEKVHASDILPGISQEYGTTEKVGASDIFPGISQEYGTTENIHAFDILPGISQEYRTTEKVDASDNFSGISQEYGTTQNIHAFDILPDISQEYGTTENGHASGIFPGTSLGNGDREAIRISQIPPKRKCESIQRSCYDLEKFGDVVCKKKMELITGSSVDIKYYFGQVHEIHIYFTHGNRLPARAFSDICIKHLVFDDPDVIIDENLLHGVELLKEFIVQRSSIKVILDFSFVRDSIEVIAIKSSRLTSLEGKHLQNLTRLSDLSFFNNSIRFIDPDVFRGTENIEKLDLSRNLLKCIPQHLLDPMKNLRTFNASCNSLLHVDNLFSIAYPQSIYLFSNNITDGNAVLPVAMKEVETLSLSNNPIKELKRRRFFSRIPNVKHLFLSHCGLQEFDDSLFFILQNLVSFDLSYNLIGEDTDAFSDENSESFNAEKYSAVHILGAFNLIGNKLRRPNKFLRCRQFIEVKLGRNRIQYLTDEDFTFAYDTSMYDMKYLKLQENQIRRIDSDTFKTSRKHLQRLDLSSNFISSLNGSVRYLSKLRSLNLTNNLIQFFARDEFAGLDELHNLYLEYNHLKEMWQFQELPSLAFLHIAHNDIKLIRMDQVPNRLVKMYLENNPFECDCRLQPFILSTTAYIETDVDLCLPSDYGSSLDTNSHCPAMCSCGCVVNGDIHFMSVDCSSRNLTVSPRFMRKSFTQTDGNETITSNSQSPFVMKMNIYSSIHIEDRVLRLNLENNSLESLEDHQLPPNLTQLYLANNKLRLLSDSILDKQVNLENVSLSGNPWNCDCDTLKFKKWLTFKHNIIQDIDDVRCGISDRGESNLNGRVIWTLDDLDLCPTDIGLMIPVSFGILSFMTICLAATILYNKYNLNIKVFLYSHGFTFVKEEDIDYDKEFDAFMAFSHEDGEFVTEEIISVIEERDPSIHMCIHYRHFKAGEFIYNNIVRAIRNSKRTVVILSENFLQSEWCLVEFRTAHMQALEDKVHRVIVIKVGDLPKDIDPAIKVHLDSTTYLTWGEKNFWNKLLFVLPTGSRVQNSFQEV